MTFLQAGGDHDVTLRTSRAGYEKYTAILMRGSIPMCKHLVIGISPEVQPEGLSVQFDGHQWRKFEKVY